MVEGSRSMEMVTVQDRIWFLYLISTSQCFHGSVGKAT